MAEQHKLPTDIEENIQNLAGDIYLQVEDKMTALVSHYLANVEITTATIENHPHFKELNQQQAILQQALITLEEQQQTQLFALNEQKQQLQNELDKQSKALATHHQFSEEKLTDSEITLKNKLEENNELISQVKSLTASEAQGKLAVQDANTELTLLNQQLSEQEKITQVLEKNDKAKAATLSVQNQQISELQLTLDQTSSELEFFKSEQEQKLKSTNQQRSAEQLQASALDQQLKKLRSEIVDFQQTQNQNNENIAQLNDENSALLNSVAVLNSEKIAVEKTQKVDQKKQTQLEQENQSLQQQLEQLDVTSSRAEQATATVLSDSEAAKAELHQQIQEYQEQLQRIAANNEALTSEISAKKTQQRKLVDDNKQLTTELADQKSIFTQLSSESETFAQTHVLTVNELDVSKKANMDITQALAKNEKNLLAQQQQLDAFEASEQALNETIIAKNKALETQIEKEKSTAHQHSQEVEKQHADHEQILAALKQTLVDKNTALTALQEQTDNTITQLTSSVSELTEKEQVVQAALATLKSDYSALSSRFEKSQLQFAAAQDEVKALQVSLSTEQERAKKNRQWVQENKDKQEVDYNKARETIKYLRDENTELTIKLDQQVTELEGKLTEYRLRFEYAQKQLSKASE